MILLKQKILKNIVLRRTKKGRAADLALPPRTVSFFCFVALIFILFYFIFVSFNSSLIFVKVFLRRDTLDIEEQNYYESLYNDSQSQFNTYVVIIFFCFVFQF